ncbi:hypothetical protein M9H77_35325 [Catharanthus roseus]|uniref:Uncharacterized protein n=1 Tax=Catharanthus roseus TaxID=4058 RepID=A0ACB9ZPF6_CATRO|nr:hypothetical protein M9H77_35325 [Catharanthus roseus]
MEEYVDQRHLFVSDRIFNLKIELVEWAKEMVMKVNTYLIVTRYLKHGGGNKPRTKPRVDDEEEEFSIKRRGPYGTTKCGCPFKLKGEQMAMCENWQLFLHDGRHNHAIGVYNHNHGQATKLTEEQLIQIEQFRKSHKIYNVVAKIKKNKMQGRNTGYTVFYRNCDDSNVLSDIIVAHPTSIEMMRTWPYVLIMDTTYKTNKYNMRMLEVVEMTSTGKNFTMATVFMRNEQATTYR